jgi:hypothetical protein
MRVMGHFGKMRSGDPPVVKNKLKLFQPFYSCTTILVVKFFLTKCVLRHFQNNKKFLKNVNFPSSKLGFVFLFFLKKKINK